MSALAPAAPQVITLGCRLNTLESAAMLKAAGAAGRADLVIVNTCAVTAEAVRQARQTIRRLARDNPGRPIVVTGCAAQTEPETFAAMPEVAEIIGNAAKLAPETWAKAAPGDFGIAASERLRVNDIMSVRETAGHLLDGLQGRARAFLQVQNGCDHRCSFCIIPYGRGNSRSVPMGEVVRQAEKLAGLGYSEIVLTGVDLTSYGADLPGSATLGKLAETLLKNVPRLARLRFSSIDQVEADPLLVELLKGEARLMPHLHLSLQSGDDLILKRMKRRHNRAQAIRFCADLRAARTDFTFGADFIAGFPTEDEAMFENTVKLVEECDLVFLHVFPFSPRRGTPAARMPQVDGAAIKARAARLRDVGRRVLERHLESRVGTIGEALAERSARGRLPDFTMVLLDRSIEPGRIVPVRVTGHDGEKLTGTVQ